MDQPQFEEHLKQQLVTQPENLPPDVREGLRTEVHAWSARCNYVRSASLAALMTPRGFLDRVSAWLVTGRSRIPAFCTKGRTALDLFTRKPDDFEDLYDLGTPD